MDPFVLIMVAVVGGLLVALLLLGLFYPGSGAAQIDWKPTRSVEVEVQNEIDDVAQMHAAINAKRRARGAGDLTQEHVREQVSEHLRLQVEQHEDVLVQEDIAQMLEAKNARRRAKGQGEITREQYIRDLGIGGGA